MEHQLLFLVYLFLYPNITETLTCHQEKFWQQIDTSTEYETTENIENKEVLGCPTQLLYLHYNPYSYISKGNGKSGR